MARLHIAVLDEELPYPLNSGKRIRTFNLLRRLAQRQRITYLCHRNPDAQESAQGIAALTEVGIRPIIVDHILPTKSGIGFYARLFGNLFSSLPYSVAMHTSAALRQAVLKLAADDPPDLWHCEWSPYAQTLRTSAARRIPWLVMAHNLESLIWQRYTETETQPLKRWYIRQQWKKYETFERWAYQTADITVAVSAEDARLMQSRFGAAHVTVVDNGVDTTTFVPNPKQTRDPRRILFLGSLDWRPNLDAVRLLIEEIFPAVLAQEAQARLIVVGRKPPDWLRSAAQRPGIELHADVPDVMPFLVSAGMLAVPLRIGGGSRLKILEALAAGVPVITSTVGVEGLHLDAGTHVTIADGVAAMTTALVEGLRQPAALQQQALAGRQRVLARYNWDKLALQLEEVWQRTVFDKARSSDRR